MDSPENTFSLPSVSLTPEMEIILREINEKLTKLDKLDPMADDIRVLKETVNSTSDLLEQTREEMDVVRKRVRVSRPPSTESTGKI